MFEHKGLPVRLQLLEKDACRYCIQFAGSGKYFLDMASAAAYIKQHFKKSMTAAALFEQLGLVEQMRLFK